MASLNGETSCSNAGYDVEDYNNFPLQPHASMVPPAVAAGLGSNSSTGSEKEASNKSLSSIASTYCYSHTSVFTSLISVFLICLLL
jgi:hypothetical protein